MQLHKPVAALWWFLLVSSVVQAQDFLQEQPAFFKPCSLKDTNSGPCLSATIENIFQQWRNGVPGLRGVGALDPFRVGKIRIAQRVPPNLDVQVALRNMSTMGLSRAKILNGTTLFNSGHYSLGFHVHLSQIGITCNYKLKGHVLVLNLNSSGILRSELDNLEFYVALKMKPQLVKGLTFMNVTAIKTDIARIDRVRVNLTNLFNGNKELESSANELFNENWRVLFEVLRPVLTQTFDAVLLDRFTKIFNYVPAKFFFADFA
ncbi:circadian clock-controlled protein daywake [Drosophila grimshawi]|uniref:GH18951 n=1 Tax=Drosophila grimshawi TaxID=7222 RepID=B4JHG2_DROGR|nr:circadian clock-controlled protein daywake [Drosophila grimshawi]EDV92789.1 GH18951 [Drosophila grimshawi]